MKTPIVADTIFHNGRITTLDPGHPEAANLAIKDGRIIGVDDAEEYQQEPNTKVIDLKGRRVIPGLNDSHLHVIRGGLNYNMELRWDGVPSLADALRMLKEQAQRTPAGQWVRVVGISIRRTPDAHVGGNQRCRADHARVHLTPVLPGLAESGGASSLWLYERHAESARRRDSA
jgi:predicted amidohydrolase YtcJ